MNVSAKFGILTMKDENDTWKENNRVKEWLEYLNSPEENFTDGCVIGANYGDGGLSSIHERKTFCVYVR